MAIGVGVGVGTYVKPLIKVALPFGLVTAIFTATAEDGGVFAIMLVSDCTEKPAASLTPNLSDINPGRNPLPVIVTLVPPVVGPELGEQDVILTIPGVGVVTVMVPVTSMVDGLPQLQLTLTVYGKLPLVHAGGEAVMIKQGIILAPACISPRLAGLTVSQSGPESLLAVTP